MPISINKSDVQQLRALEDVLTTAKRWAMEEARALLEIKKRGLWKVTDFSSFNEYATTRWGYDRVHIFRLIQWAQVMQVLPVGNVPQRESISRPLNGLTPQQQVKAWKTATTNNADPTAEEVTEAVQAVVKRTTQQRSSETPQAVSGEIVQGSAAKMLKTLPDRSIDLIFTSPPYAMQRKKDFPSVEEADYPRFTVEWMEAARQKMKTTGSIIINIREHVRDGQISDYLLRTRLAIRDAGWCEIDTMIWMKPDAPPLGRGDRPRRTWEYLLWYCPTNKPFTAVKECGQPPRKRSEMVKLHSYKSAHHTSEPFGRFRADVNARIPDIFAIPVSGNVKGINHPAVFPPLLAEQMVKTFSAIGGLVVDPMCGSGTTLLAARNNGRRYWGCDILQRFVTLSRKRLSQQQKGCG